MTTVLIEQQDDHRLAIQLPSLHEMTDDEFFEFCRVNRDLRIERTAEGEIIVMPPTGGETGNRDAKLTVQLGVWSDRDGTGEVFDSSTGFKLPNGAERSPDAAWVSHSRLALLTAEQKRKFIPLCPDFAIELRSPTDRLIDLKEKMEEYIANSVRLGWLLDPQEKRVYVYMPGREVEFIDGALTISGEPVLPGFSLELRPIWAPRL
jgi:Uma2 family endonuclease